MAATSGGKLVSRIFEYTENGDPFVQQFTDSVLEEVSPFINFPPRVRNRRLTLAVGLSPSIHKVSKPFFYSLSQWIYHGDLHDPFSEFFVFPNPSLAHASYVTTSSTLLGAEDLGFGREGERGEGVKSWELWKRKWEFKEDMRPTFVSKEFARKVSPPPPPPSTFSFRTSV